MQITPMVCTSVLSLLSVIRSSTEYGTEVWESNKNHASSLESIILDGPKQTLRCSSKTCNEAVIGDMDLDTLQSHRDRRELKWWYKIATVLCTKRNHNAFLQSSLISCNYMVFGHETYQNDLQFLIISFITIVRP